MQLYYLYLSKGCQWNCFIKFTIYVIFIRYQAERKFLYCTWFISISWLGKIVWIWIVHKMWYIYIELIVKYSTQSIFESNSFVFNLKESLLTHIMLQFPGLALSLAIVANWECLVQNANYNFNALAKLRILISNSYNPQQYILWNSYIKSIIVWNNGLNISFLQIFC